MDKDVLVNREYKPAVNLENDLHWLAWKCRDQALQGFLLLLLRDLRIRFTSVEAKIKESSFRQSQFVYMMFFDGIIIHMPSYILLSTSSWYILFHTV